MENLPEWAEKESDGNYLQVGAQLCTRDGRKCGNAIVGSVYYAHGVPTAKVITDCRTTMRLTEAEIKELFYPPKFIMKSEFVFSRVFGL